MKKIAIIGASGHGKVVADIAVKNGYSDIVFLDDSDEVRECGGFPVVGKTSIANELDCDKIVAIGNAEIRRAVMEKLDRVVTLIHPSAVVTESVTIGAGSVVMAGAVINPQVKIGRGVIINTCASVDHDCIIGDYAHVSVGAHIAGTVIVGENTWIGIGAAVSNNLNICADCMIGAGATVINNINEKGTYFGVPARLFFSRKS